MCKKSEVRRIRKAKNECGCASLQDFLLLAVQTKSVPRKLDVSAEVRMMRRLEKGEKVDPSYEIPKFALALADEILARRGSVNPLKGLWAARYSSGRVIA